MVFFIRFFDHEGIGVDTKIMILCKLELKILSKLDFRCGNFVKWPKPLSRPNFFSGNIVNIIHRSPLIKMVSLMESSGGTRGPILAHGLLVAIINQDVNKNTI